MEQVLPLREATMRAQAGPVDLAREATLASVADGAATTFAPYKRYALDVERLREQRVVFPQDASPAAHAFRMLRTQLRKVTRERDARIVGVVSATTGEGKTLTAINLALSLAADPATSVVLLDLDLRRPTMASTLGLEIALGLDDYLNGEARAQDVAVGFEGIERLTVVPMRSSMIDSASAIAGARLQGLLKEIGDAREHPIAIVDLPPVLLSDDMLMAAGLLDGVVVVAREGLTRREDLQRLRVLLGKMPILGSVLNAATDAEMRTY